MVPTTRALRCGEHFHSIPGISFCLPAGQRYVFVSVVKVGCDITSDADNLGRMPPGKNIDDWYTVLRSGMWRLYFQLSTEGRQRYYNEMLPLLHDTKAEVLGERDENAYYLVYLGTKPHARGRGYARKLLQTMIERVRPHAHLRSS